MVIGRDGWRHARWPGLVAQQPVDTGLHEPFLTAPHAGFALASTAHDLDRADAIGAQKHDPGSPDMLLGAVAVGHHRFETSTVGGRRIDDDPLAHAPDSHPPRAEGNPFGFFR